MKKEDDTPVYSNEAPPLILIVDDLNQNLAVLGNILRTEGHQLAIANNGRQAISIALAKNPDLILLDIAMPDLDGLSACRMLKDNKLTKDIPVIFLTARTEPEDILKGFEAGAVDYITKPFKAGELLARVATHLELKKSRDIIIKQKNELTEALATKDKLFSIISHDLKSPFSGLMLMSKLLVENFESFEKNDLLESITLIRDTADQVHELMQNLLSWARLQNESLSYNPTKLFLAREVSKTIEVLRLNSAKKSITIDCKISNDYIVSADADLLRIIFHNLIGNAIKFSKNNSFIEVKAELSDGFVISTVKDNGVGISAEKIDGIFKDSPGKSTSGTANEVGSGLGLVLCREMVEKMGGTIGVESEQGAGSTFWFTLPVD
jgi:signal transduction histidine kinase